MKNHLKVIILITSFFLLSYCEDIYFGRSQVCIQEGSNGCLKWNVTVNLSYYYGSTYYMCFPASTRVYTQNGPIQMSKVQIGDKVLAFNFEQGKNVFSPVTAWLHRDTDSQVEFTNIITKNGNAYRSSAGHNIAFNNNGTIGFKYADQLKNGDQLYSINGQYIVESSNQKSNDLGLYSPMTETSNFYIYPYQSVEDNDLSNSLILVHCLAQIDNPHKKQHWVHRIMALSDWFGLNSHKNQLHENYFHPITHLMKIFGDQHRLIKYQAFVGDENHLQSLNYGSGSSSYSNWGSSSTPSYSYTPSYSNSYGYNSYNSYYGGGYYYGDYYYSQQRQRQQRKMQIVGVFACLMQLNGIIISV